MVLVSIFIPPLFHKEIKIQSWRFDTPSKLAEVLGLVTNDVRLKILASVASCPYEIRVMAYSHFLGYRYLLQIPHNILPLGNHSFYG